MKTILMLYLIIFTLVVGCQKRTTEREISRTPTGKIYKIETKLNKPLYESLTFHSDSTDKPYIKNSFYIDDNGNTIKHGCIEGWDENGTKRYVEIYKHGKATENFINWYKNGLLKDIKQTTKYGASNEYFIGSFNGFYENGNKMVQAIYSHEGSKDSYWHKNGQLACKGYKDNKTNIGKSTIWDIKGNKLAEVVVNFSTKTMIVKFWTKEGKFFAEGTYKNDAPWSGKIISGYRKGDKHPGKLIIYKDGRILEVKGDAPDELLNVSFFPEPIKSETTPDKKR